MTVGCGLQWPRLWTSIRSELQFVFPEFRGYRATLIAAAVLTPAQGGCGCRCCFACLPSSVQWLCRGQPSSMSLSGGADEHRAGAQCCVAYSPLPALWLCCDQPAGLPDRPPTPPPELWGSARSRPLPDRSVAATGTKDDHFSLHAKHTDSSDVPLRPPHLPPHGGMVSLPLQPPSTTRIAADPSATNSAITAMAGCL
jgi:hypothetical protein